MFTDDFKRVSRHGGQVGGDLSSLVSREGDLAKFVKER